MFPRKIFTALLLALLLNSTLVAQDQPGNLVLKNCATYWRYQVTLASDQPGVIAVLPWEEGDFIKKRQLVTKLDDRVLQARLAVVQKEAEGTTAIEAAEKAHLVAKAEWDKALEANLVLSDVIPELEIKRLKLQSERTKLEWDQAIAEQELKQLAAREVQANLQMMRIRSPLSGVVTKIEKSVGESVQQGEPILEITNLDVLRVETNVPPEVASQLRRKQPVFAIVRGERFEGHLQFIDVTVQPSKPLVQIRAELRNPSQKLLAGTRIDLVIPPAADTPIAGRTD